jgi:hypothetical protein
VVPEFTITPLDGQDDVTDGLFLGHLDVKGSSGSATTRSSRQPDGGMGIVLFPVVVDLLNGLAGLLERGRGKFASDDMGLSLTFKLKDGTVTVKKGFSTLDESPARDVADAVWTAAKGLSDSLLEQVTEATEHSEITEDGTYVPIDYRVQLPKALARFQEARAAVGG